MLVDDGMTRARFNVGAHAWTVTLTAMSDHAAGKPNGHASSSSVSSTQLAKKQNRTAEFRELIRAQAASSSSSALSTGTRDIYHLKEAKNQQEKESLLKRKNADAEWIAEARRIVRSEMLRGDPFLA